jgi:hypothetical protein
VRVVEVCSLSQVVPFSCLGCLKNTRSKGGSGEGNPGTQAMSALHTCIEDLTIRSAASAVVTMKMSSRYLL